MRRLMEWSICLGLLGLLRDITDASLASCNGSLASLPHYRVIIVQTRNAENVGHRLAVLLHSALLKITLQHVTWMLDDQLVRSTQSINTDQLRTVSLLSRLDWLAGQDASYSFLVTLLQFNDCFV